MIPRRLTFLCCTVALVSSTPWSPIGVQGAAPAFSCADSVRLKLGPLVGRWEVQAIFRQGPTAWDSTSAIVTIAPDLNGCVLREHFIGRRWGNPYEYLALWGVNGDAARPIQRTFVHSQHGYLGLSAGSFHGDTLVLHERTDIGPMTVLEEAMMKLRSILLAVLFLPQSGSVAAQWSPSLREGARVKVRLPEKEFQFMGARGQDLRGTVARLAPDTLYLRISDSLSLAAIPRTLIGRLDLSKGVPSRASSAARTGIRWGILYALLFALYDSGESTSLSNTERTVIGGGIGLSIGAVFGAIYPVERWKHLRLEPRLANTGPGTLDLAVGISW